MGVAGGTALATIAGSYALNFLLGLVLPSGYLVLLGVVAFVIALVVDNGNKARPVKEALLGGLGAALLATLAAAYLPRVLLASLGVVLPALEPSVAVDLVLIVAAVEFFGAFASFALSYSLLDWYGEGL